MEYLGIKLEMGIHKVLPLEQGIDKNQFDFLVGFEEKSDRYGNHTFKYFIMNQNMNLINLRSENWTLESTFESTSAFAPVLMPKLEDRDGVINELEIDSYKDPLVIGKVFDVFYQRAKFYNWSHYNLVIENAQLKKRVEELERELKDCKERA